MRGEIFAKVFAIVVLMLFLALGCNKEKANQLPTCKITAPADGQKIIKGETVTISVEAIDSDGSIAEVRFFVDGVGKSSANSFPFNYNWNTTDESTGSHILKATSIDNSGGSNSDEITVEISLDGGGEPCPGMETITYGGQVYNTVLIGTKCWLKENLNVGTMIPGSQDMADNSTIEKYCYENNPSNCETYGGLYQWNEMMQYNTQQGVKGICPSGWHIPTDDELKILEGTVDSQYGVGDPEWNGIGVRGFDACFHLKSTAGWYGNGNGDDSFGFTALPGGYRTYYGSFGGLGNYADFWSSTESNGSHAWGRSLGYDYDKVLRGYSNKTNGFSARCLQD